MSFSNLLGRETEEPGTWRRGVANLRQGWYWSRMPNFQGGSVYAVVQNITSGVLLVTDKTLKRLSVGELQQLAMELDRQLRMIRSEQPPLDDTKAVQNRHRRIQKLNSALTMLRAHKQKRKPKLQR